MILRGDTQNRRNALRVLATAIDEDATSDFEKRHNAR
jgi:hypothetical protein